MDQTCPKCERLFRHGDKIRAVVLSSYVTLKSKAIFAIEKPYDCERIEHVVCSNPAEGD